jgi:hypothetical protein
MSSETDDGQETPRDVSPRDLFRQVGWPAPRRLLQRLRPSTLLSRNRLLRLRRQGGKHWKH